MVLGLSRMQPRSARPPLEPISESTSSQGQHWLAQRGAVLFEATCAVMGGFPGFADQGGELDGAELRVSDRFLLVDEGKPHGFGIPIQWLDGALLTPQPERDDADLRLLYSDGAQARSFSIRFRPNRLAMRGGKRAERAQDALFAAGLAETHAISSLDPAEFALPWERTHDFDAEPVIWTGHAAAPVRVGEELAPSEIWLSTNSLIWGSSEGSGLNRLAVAAIGDFAASRLKDRLGTPAIYLGVAGERFGRHEVAFVFNQQETPDRNFRERGDFLAGLRSRAIPEGAVAPLWQPWRLDLHPASRQDAKETSAPEPEPAPLSEAPGVRARLESWLPRLQTVVGRGLSLPSVEEEQAKVVAFEPIAFPEMDPTEPIRFDPRVPSLKNEPVSPEDETPIEAALEIDSLDDAESIAQEPKAAPSADANLAEMPVEATVETSEPATAVGCFENAALALVADAIRGIEVRLETGLLEPLAPWVPLGRERDSAFVELRDAAAAKLIKKRELRRQTARLIDLYDAGARLRSIVELYDRGHLDNPQLEALRTKLLARVVLAPTVVPLSACRGETDPRRETFSGV